MNREKVVEIFDELRNFADNDIHPVVSPENWHVYSKLCDLIDKAETYILALLKEQEAIKPLFKTNPVTGTEEYICGNCQCRLLFELDRYCPHCGKAVKWDD